MCGIFVRAGRNVPFHHRLLSSLHKRGPDEIGFWSDGRVNLAHTRLAIIGLDSRSSEPMFNDRYVLVYNGEIYNFLEIKRDIEKEGIPCPGANDAEVLLHAWSLWGSAVLSRISGFWAFVIYDRVAETLTLVRDQLGIKPLYYRVTGESIEIGSMIRTILEVVNTSRDFDFEALSEYARYQFTFGDKTFLKDIKKVMPGHLIEIDLKTHAVRDRVYENILEISSQASTSSHAELVGELQELVRDVVLESTISDTSFTTFCSGGVDSSLITRLARPELAYHCNFSDPDCNETFFAQQAVEGSGTRLFVVNAQEEFNLVEKLADIVRDFDELTIGSVILPLDDLLSQVRRRFKVILTGTGGDELFAGYVRYLLALGSCNQDNYRQLFQKVRALPNLTERFAACHSKGDVSVFRFYQPHVEQTFRSAFEQCDVDGNPLRTMLRFDQKYFLAGLLNIDDKMCARHSLEARPSFLHQRLVRRVQQLAWSPEEFVAGGELKPLLRAVAQGTLPNSVIHRKDKMGFTTPIGTFVNKSAHLVREQITSSRFNDHYDLKRINFTAESKYSREIFGLLLLDLWLNTHGVVQRQDLSHHVEIIRTPNRIQEGLAASAPAVLSDSDTAPTV